MSLGEATIPAPKCTLLDGILLGKDLEQPVGQEILEEGSCVLQTQDQWLNLFPQLPQVTSKGGELAAICRQRPMAKVAKVTTKVTPCHPAGWCLPLSVGRSCPRFPQTVGMEEPLLELARVPACSDSHPERRRGAEASL